MSWYVRDYNNNTVIKFLPSLSPSSLELFQEHLFNFQMTSSLGLVLKSVIYVVVGYTNIPFVVMETRWPNVLDASIVRNEMTLIWGTLRYT